MIAHVSAPPPAAVPRRRARSREQQLLVGAATFVDDVRPPGALAAAIVRSAEPHGRLRGVDCAGARRLPGVHAVLTAADLPSVPVVPVRSFERPGMASALQPVIAVDRVRYVGEPVAVVVAESRALAEDAAEHVVVDVEPLPPVLDVDGRQEPLFDRPEGNLLCRWTTGQGDVDAVLAGAAVVVEEELATGRHTGVPLETRGLVAEWSADGRSLRLWGPTKFLTFTRSVVAGWFGVDEGDVECRHVSVGGMFGVRGELYPEDFLVPWAARLTGRPVRWCEDRREHLLAVNHAPDLRYRLRLGLGDDGRLLALSGEVLVDMGAYVRTNGGRLVLLAIEELLGPYAWQATAIAAEGRATSKAPVGSVRAPVALESTFARERLVDLAARRLELDPAEVRRRSLVPALSMPFARRLGGDAPDQVYADGDFPAFFSRLLDSAGYDALLAEREGRRARGELVGVGIGLFVAHSGLGVEERVEVGVREGRVVVRTAASDVGQGLDEMVRRVAAEALGVPAGDVEVESGTTGGDVSTGGTFSSRGTIFVGSAVRDACERLLAEAGGARDRAGLDGLAVAGTHHDPGATYGFGGHVALVSVDDATGAVTVERLAVACDCGRPLDAGSVRDQLRGGTVHGLGVTLLEELRYDGYGDPVGGSFADYLLPAAADVPATIAIELLDGWATTNPLGVKGAGEAGVVGVGAAVANAVADALGPPGGSITRLPLTPDAIVAARAGVGPPGLEPGTYRL